MEFKFNRYSNRIGQSRIGALRKRCDKLFFRLLCHERGRECEVCHRVENITPHHIILKAARPRLRYHRQNIVLLCLMPCHHYMHHDSHDPRAKRVEKYIIKTHGKNYREELLIMDRIQWKHNITYLSVLCEALKKQLSELEGIV